MALSTTRLITNLLHAADNNRFIVGQTLPSADPLYPATNIFAKDRMVKHVLPPPGSVSSVTYPIDLRFAQRVDVVGLTGMASADAYRPTKVSVDAYVNWPNPTVATCAFSGGSLNVTRVAGATFPPTVTVGQLVTGTGIDTNTYVNLLYGSPPFQIGLSKVTLSPQTSVTLTFSDKRSYASGGVQNLVRTGSGADVYYVLPQSTTSMFYFVTFEDMPNGYALGSVLLGQITDLGIAYSPGSSESRLLSRVHNTTANQTTTSATVGLDRKRLAYKFLKVTDTTRSRLDTAVAGSPFLVITPKGELLEVQAAADRIEATTAWGDPELYDVTLDAESLP